MTEELSKPESFEAFKKSFCYGLRSDMNFKFLFDLTDGEAARFFQDLLWKLGDSFNDGDFDRIVDHVYSWQIKGYASEKRFAYDDGPFVPLRKPLAKTRLALMTSSGHFVQGDDPNPLGVADMTQQEAERRIMEFIKKAPTLSSIQVDTPKEKLKVRHGGYDIRGALADPNVVFPIEILSELKKEGILGALFPEAFSFVGACSQKRLLKDTGPAWVKTLQAKEIEAVLLIPV